MPVAVTCPKCQKKYNLPDHMLGQVVKCTACAAQFRTAAPGGAGQPRRQMDPRQIEAHQRAAAESQRAAIELKKMGVDGPLQRSPDVFDGLGAMEGTTDPLNNHVIEDPGFGDARYEFRPEEPEESDPMASMFENPAAPKPKKKTRKKKSKSKKKKNTNLLFEPWFWLTVVFLPLYGLLYVLCLSGGISGESAELAFLAISIPFFFASFAVGIWSLYCVYQTTPSIGQVLLCVFIPFYWLYYLHKHWASMHSVGNAFYANLAISIVISVLSNYIDGMLEVTA